MNEIGGRALTAIVASASFDNSTTGDDNDYHHSFMSDIVLYFLVKIVTSLDDLLWLSPFLAIASSGGSGGEQDTTRQRQRQHSQHQHQHHHRHDDKISVFVIYITICLLISIVALFLSWLANTGLTLLLLPNGNNGGDDSGEEDDGKYDTDQVGRILNIVGGLCIALFAYFEWKSSNNDDDDSDESDYEDASQQQQQEEVDDQLPPSETTSLLEKGLMVTAQNNHTTTPNEGHVTNGISHGRANNHHQHHNHASTGEQHQQHDEEYRRRHVLIDLFIVGIFGQLDTLAIFFSVLVGQKTSVRVKQKILPVLIGSVLAAFVILTIAYCITLFKPLTKWLQRIPLWILLCVISIYVILQGIINF